MKILKEKNRIIVLASSSIPRKEILTKLGLKHSVIPSYYEEKMKLKKDEDFPTLAMRLSRGKAEDVAKNTKNAIVIGADSFAVFGKKILGKPGKKENAIKFLEMLSGKSHKFYTGMTVIDTVTGKIASDSIETTVYFRKLTLDEIKKYIAKEEVVTAAGAYRIQGLGSTLVRKVEGDYYAVAGLSPTILFLLFKRLGLNLFDYTNNPSNK